jgi:transcriptional regulator with XRE-family HTH domain
MTTQPEGGLVPVWTMGDRLRKARAMAGLNTRDFAVKIGISHGSITNAENDRVTVRPITLNAWALATGVSREWLETGDGSPDGPDGLPQTDVAARLAKLAGKKRAHSGAPRTNHRYDEAA